MAYIKTDWTDGMVISEAGLDHLENGVYNNSVAIGDLTDLDTTDKTNLVAAINEAAQSGGGSGGMSNAVKDALLQLASKVAYIDEDGQDYYDDLYNALYPAAEIVSINAEYTQTGTVYTTTSLEDLRNDLVVTAIYDNGSVVPVISYTLSGTLTVGESTITATYSGFTDTFEVTVSAAPTVSSIAAVYTQSGTVYDTDSLDSLKADLVVTATYSDSSTATVPSADYTLSGTLTVGTSTITVSYESKTTTFNVTVSTNLIAELDQSDFVIGTLQNTYRSGYAAYGGYITVTSSDTKRMGYPLFDVPTEANTYYQVVVDWNTTYDLYMSILTYDEDVQSLAANHSAITPASDSGWQSLSGQSGVLTVQSPNNSAMRFTCKIGSAGTTVFQSGIDYINSIKIYKVAE